MALYKTPEEKAQGEANFESAVGQSRRDFLKAMAAGGTALPLAGAAFWFGYKQPPGKALKVGLIGTGDEGGVLTGFHNPAYTEIVAVADIRPYNMARSLTQAREKKDAVDRIFRGESRGPRLGLNKVYGKATAEGITRYVDYKEMLDDPNVEAIIIALPLHLHAPVAIEAMDKGKHVFCEKLMARSIAQCKDMIKAARRNKRVLAIGHQRHYSLLYAHALEIVKSGHLGTIKHIRALWHRNNSWPRLDSKGNPIMEGDLQVLRDSWRKSVPDVDREALEGDIKKYGYDSMEQLIRWRLYNKTGGGLMAELGSHQLDACSIFLGKVKPLAVSGVGGKYFYEDDREADDHVFTTFEFPGETYWEGGKEFGTVQDRNDQVVMTYSSINTNSFEPYGECLMGTHATLVVEGEKVAALYPERNPNAKTSSSTSAKVKTAGKGQAAVDSSSTTGYADPADQAMGKSVMGAGPVSRGYREELEDFAFCVRMHDATSDPTEQALWREGPITEDGTPRGPRCHGVVAMADAIMALTSNLAMDTRTRIEFKQEWFDANNTATPEDDAEIKAALDRIAPKT